VGSQRRLLRLVFAAMYIAVNLRLLRILALNDGEAALAIMAHAANQFLFLVMFLPVMYGPQAISAVWTFGCSCWIALRAETYILRPRFHVS